jgi:GAF domain
MGVSDIPGVMRAMHSELQRVLDARICMCGVFDPATQTVDVVWQIHDGEELPGGSFPLGSGFTSRVIRSGQPLLIRDWSANGPRVQVQYATQKDGLPQSSITAPIRVGGQVRGVISVQSYAPATFDEKDLAFLSGIADQIASMAFDSPSAEPATSVAEPTIGELILDEQRRLVQLNDTARKRLCAGTTSVILGYPIFEPQQGRWPLGTQALTERLRPLLDGQVTEVDVEDAAGERQTWSASILPVGARLQFRAA